MPKSEMMEKFLETHFGTTTAVKNKICALCNEPATVFRDEFSKKEFTLSGLCQKCQDEIFN